MALRGWVGTVYPTGWRVEMGSPLECTGEWREKYPGSTVGPDGRQEDAQSKLHPPHPT